MDATPLLGNPTGVGVVTRALVEGLADRDDVDLLAFALTWRGRDDLAHILPEGVRTATRHVRGRELALPMAARALPPRRAACPPPPPPPDGGGPGPRGGGPRPDLRRPPGAAAPPAHPPPRSDFHPPPGPLHGRPARLPAAAAPGDPRGRVGPRRL